MNQAIRDLENRRLTERINKLYEEGRKKDPEVFRENILQYHDKKRTVKSYLLGIDIGQTDLDAKGLGIQEYLVKPISPLALKKRICTAFGLKQERI